MRIIVTGAHGMLGSAVIPTLQQCGHDVLATDITDDALVNLDVRDFSAVMAWVKAHRPCLVVHLAAETSLETCEVAPDHAWFTNAIGTRNVALACNAADVPMAYVSSAGVFDGTKIDAYTEFDVPNPINIYGASKFAGEQFVRQHVQEHWIVRAGWMLGGGRLKDHKFVSHVVRQLDEGVTVIHAVADKFGTPTYAKDFATCFESLAQSERFGTYHMASPGSCSRLDIATAIVDILGYGDKVEVRAASSAYFAKTFFAPRPESEVMRNYVLELEGRQTMRPWRAALSDYLWEWA